jgi:hypothetical protein
MFISQKENAPFKEEIKKLLKKLHHLLWMKQQDKKWETKLLILRDHVDIQPQELLNF